VYHREAFQAEQFDIDKLRRFCQALPSGFVLRQVRQEEVTQFAMDLDPALVYNFRSHEEFITRGVGLGILHRGTFICGASSAAVRLCRNCDGTEGRKIERGKIHQQKVTI
jgi:hypothetical protein